MKAEEILKKYPSRNIKYPFNDIVYGQSDVIEAMKEYARIKCAEQREICQRLADAEKTGLIDAVIGNVYENCPEPKFH